MEDDDDDYGSDLDEELLIAASNSYESSLNQNRNNSNSNQNNNKSTPYRQSTSTTAVTSARKSATASARKNTANNHNNNNNNNYDDLLEGLSTSDLEDEDSFVQQRNPPPALNRQGSSNMRQRTLFGDVAEQQDEEEQGTLRGWRLVNHEEPPTHHKIDREAARTWVYPSNLTKRDYQFNIAKRALLSNVLVALPTGLGKTLIAATVMLNWYRWAPESYVIFLAPTKPLVNQQVDACYHIVGIPRSDTCQLTGGVSPAQRADYWSRKRVFFMTPQTLATDLTSGRCDAKKVVLVVIDEAHRATGEYAYNTVLRFIRRFNKSFRVMALTATPGAKIETVQEVITNLGIARTEIRTEESLDIRGYVQERNVEVMALPVAEEITMLSDYLAEALRPLVKKLNEMRVLFITDPANLNAFGVHQARQQWMNSNAGRQANWAVKAPVMARLGILSSVAHAFELLLYHGIRPFYDYLLDYQREETDKSTGGGKLVKSVFSDDNWKAMLREAKKLLDQPNYLGHPKLDTLCSIILQHFSNASDRGEADTKVMVFSNYRKSGEEIVRVLNTHKPIIKPKIFVGQSAGKTGEGGMSQKEQGAVLDRFKSGEFNVLVATSIGEEGLDIGEVDFIVCYDASASPIRMLQRMGRTGRKRLGGVVVLVTEGREANKWEKAKDNYQFMQKRIAAGTDFQYADDLSPRIIPLDITPEVDMQHIIPPVENTQPSPKKQTRGRKQKAPPKVFQMPDGVETGFTTASIMGGFKAASTKKSKQLDDFLVTPPKEESEEELLEEDVNEELYPEKPDDESFLLTPSQEKELARRYRNVADGEEYQVIRKPELDKHPELMLSLRPTKFIKHSRTTKSHVRLLRTMQSMNSTVIEKYQKNLHPDDTKITLAASSPAATSLRKLSAPVVKKAASNVNTTSSALDNVYNMDFTSARSKLAKFAAQHGGKKFKPPMLNRKPAAEEEERDIIPISSGESTFSAAFSNMKKNNNNNTAKPIKEKKTYESFVPSSPSSIDDELPSASQILRSSRSEDLNTEFSTAKTYMSGSSGSGSKGTKRPNMGENIPPAKALKRKSDPVGKDGKRVRR